MLLTKELIEEREEEILHYLETYAPALPVVLFQVALGSAMVAFGGLFLGVLGIVGVTTLFYMLISMNQAKLAAKASLDALVCSAHEVPYVKHIFKKEIITPGIRLMGDKTKDQKRIMTPKKAFENGANSIVIGRSITKGNVKKNIQRLIKSLN